MTISVHPGMIPSAPFFLTIERALLPYALRVEILELTFHILILKFNIISGIDILYAVSERYHSVPLAASRTVYLPKL